MSNEKSAGAGFGDDGNARRFGRYANPKWVLCGRRLGINLGRWSLTLFLHSSNASTPHALRTKLRPCRVPFVRQLRCSRVPQCVRYCATTAPLVHLHATPNAPEWPQNFAPMARISLSRCVAVALHWQSCVKSMSHPLQTYCTSIASSFLHRVAPCCTVFTCFAAVAPQDRRIVGPRADESTAATIGSEQVRVVVCLVINFLVIASDDMCALLYALFSQSLQAYFATMVDLKCIGKHVEDGTALHCVARASAYAHSVGIVFLNGVAGCCMESSKLRLQHCTKQMNKRLDNTVCSDGDSANWPAPGAVPSVQCYASLLRDCSIKELLVAPTVQSDQVAPRMPEKVSPSRQYFHHRQPFQEVVPRPSAVDDEELLHVLRKIGWHSPSNGLNHYVLRDPEQDARLSQVLVSAVLGAQVSWRIEELLDEVHAQSQGLLEWPMSQEPEHTVDRSQTRGCCEIRGKELKRVARRVREREVSSTRLEAEPCGAQATTRMAIDCSAISLVFGFLHAIAMRQLQRMSHG